MRSTKDLTMKDLIGVGVFCALYFLVTLVSGFFFASNPVLTYGMPLSVAFFTGPVYLLMLAKIPKRGATLILGVVMGLLVFVTGMFWMWSIAYVVLGAAAGEIAARGQFRSCKMNSLSFIVFALNPLVSYSMIWLDREGFQAYLLQQGTPAAYMDVMLQTANELLLPGMFIGTVAAAWAGVLFGRVLLKKHFIRAGVV